MKTSARLAFASSAAILLATACSAPVETGGETADAGEFIPDIPVENIEAHIRFLAHDALQGRASGSEGYQIATNYVASQYRLLGLQPAGDEGGYFAAVPMQYMSPVAEAGRLVIGEGDEAVELENGSNLIVSAHPVHDQASITAEVVFVGYGLSLPHHGYDDYDGIDVNGRIVAYIGGAPDIMPSDERSHQQRSSTKRANAAERGAIGYIQISSAPTENYSGFAARAISGSDIALGPDGAEPAYNQLMVASGVSREGGEALFANADMTLEEALEQLQSGEPASMPLNVTVTLEQETTRELYTDYNVVGMIPGSDPELADEVVVLTAHLDHIGHTDENGVSTTGCRSNNEEDRICNGAVDNASGSAIMLETARAFMESEAPRRSVLFVALAAEEQGLLGSEYFAFNPTIPEENMVANVNLDMPVIVYDFADVIAFGAERSSLGPIAERAAARLGVTISPDPIPEQNLFIRSDHYNFVRRGVPSVFLMTGFSSPDPRWDEGEGFMGFLTTHYHRQSDEVDSDEDLEILYEQGAKFANINFLIAREIANNDEAPTWNEGDYFGEFFGGNR
ncbi:M28 family peptidase [Hyphobacterium sp. HN65]|uniref:M28 family peptidase n=1 Tax=Hyphobacterium lacteum TaxID=3116575 RepID=A0ABU7LR78_9PROT|nr:M28 family peptidase [Hyphobacterium sp. HN65]MEE2526141.1 M28 family peptidase [Hyphobacterium sp. HN65]